MDAETHNLGSQEPRLFLQNELIRRISRNQRYSLRAFAKSLRMDASLLSKVLKGKRKVSRKLVNQISDQLGLPPPESLKLLGPASPASDSDDAVKYRQLTLDHFHLISDWYHYALLALTKVQGFRSSVRWAAKALGIGTSEVNVAIERLERLGLLRIDEQGNWIEVSDFITNEAGAFTASALRTLQRQVLQMAVGALEEIPVEARDQSSMTLEIDTALLPEARTKIKRFRRDLTKQLQKTGKCDQVYHLSISLYPVTQIKKGGIP